MSFPLFSSIHNFFSTLMLSKSLEFETQRSLEDCVQYLQSLDPMNDPYQFSVSWKLYKITLQQADNYTYYYYISLMQRNFRLGTISEWATISGELRAILGTKRTFVTGNVSANPVQVTLLSLLILFISGLFLFSSTPASPVQMMHDGLIQFLFQFFGVCLPIFAVYRIYRDHAKLYQTIEDLKL